MGIVNEMAFEQLDFVQLRLKEYSQKEIINVVNWGERTPILGIGKPKEELVFHAKPKSISSARQQIVLLYGWFPKSTDRRTRRIGKHYFQMAKVERQTVLEEWEEWKKWQEFEGFTNLSIIDFKEKEKKTWSYPFEKLTEEEILKLHEEEEEKWSYLPEEEVKGLFFDVEKLAEQGFMVEHWEMEDPKELYENEILTASKERKEFILNNEAFYEKTISSKKFKEVKKLRSKFLRYERALKVMKSWTEDRESQYILTNPVYATYKEIETGYGRRKIERVTELHTLFSEIDQYSEKSEEQYRHMTSKQIYKEVIKKLDREGLPRPTEAIFSRGLQLYWKHAPIPEYMIEEWNLLMRHINKTLAEFGADPKALDAVRILRAVGSIHEKTGKKITGLTFTDDRYDFHELFNSHCKEQWAAYLKEKAIKLQERVAKKAKEVETKRKWMKQKGFLDENGNPTGKYDKTKKKTGKKLDKEAIASVNNYIHANRKAGIFHLCKVRNGWMDGCRELSCFLTRYWTLCITGGNKIEANAEMWELYESFADKGYSWDDMLYLTASAEDWYEKWRENNEKGLKYSTGTLIEKLKITPQEMKVMRFIVDEKRKYEIQLENSRIYKEKTNYNQEYYQKKLAEQGKMTKKEEKAFRADWIKNFLNHNPNATQQHIADELGINKSTVCRMLKEFNI